MRSWHTANRIPGTRTLVIAGGYNGNDVSIYSITPLWRPYSPCQALTDSFILDLDKHTWAPTKEHVLDKPTAGAASVVDGDAVAVFGGGDNEGQFYNTIKSTKLSAL